MAITLSDLQRLFLGADVNEKEQQKNDGNAPPLNGNNGDPNDAGDPSSVGIEVGDVIYAPYVIEPGTAAFTGRVWVLWKGRTTWAVIPGFTIEANSGEPATEEIKVRSMDRIYFERTDGSSVDWHAYLEEES